MQILAVAPGTAWVTGANKKDRHARMLLMVAISHQMLTLKLQKFVQEMLVQNVQQK
jgi:hypothetical protein